MQPVQIKQDIYWVGVQDPGLRVFDVIMHTKYGTSYNSYLIRGKEKIALSESVKEIFFSEYLEKLKSLIDIHSIDYILVNHTEPDHSGSIANLLELSPQAKIVGSSAAIKFLRQIVNLPFEAIEVKDGDKLDLGGKTLNFIAAPFLHWPDSIYTYIPEEKLILTCDSFGSHYSSEKIFNDLIEDDPLQKSDMLDAYHYYYEMIMGPFKPYVLQAIEKIKDLPLEVICPGHGLVLRKNIWDYVQIYKDWSQSDLGKQKRVTISYVSAYGYTASLAEKIAEGIKSVGDFQVYLFNVIENNQDDMLKKITYSQGLLFGSPTINRDALQPIWNLLSYLNPLIHGGKLAAAFGSYGWSGEAVPALENRLANLKLKVIPGLKINFKPSLEELEKAYQYGLEFGQKLLACNK